MNTMRHYREIIAYVFFGVLAVLLNCILYILFNHFWVYEFANGIGNALANFICIIFAYVTNRIAVFCSKSSGISANTAGPDRKDGVRPHEEEMIFF